MTESTTDIDTLLGATASPENADAILEWFRGLNGRIARGDLMLGILDFDEVEGAPAALAHAAKGGRPLAHLLCARWLIEPPVGAPDHDAALESLRAAIDAGVDGADETLVRFQWFFRRDVASEEERDEALARARAQVERDPEDADALHLLGHLVTGGFGDEPDPAAGFELQRRAAELGSAGARFEMYVHLSTGLGVDADPAAAFEATRLAAEAGHPRALYNLGAALARGDQVPRDMAKAASYYARACELGNGQACATLAAMYFMGDGVEADADEAEELFDTAECEGFDTTRIKLAIGWDRDDDE